MTTKSKSATAKKAQRAASETSKSIEEQTEAFFKAGGKIQQIRSGVSGMQSLAGPKHITLGKKPRE